MTRRGDPLRGEELGRGEALVQGHAGTDERDRVRGTRADDLGAADREVLAGAVDDGVGAAGGPDVADARAVGHRDGERHRRGRVGGVEDGRTVTARIEARSSRAICDGPSAPISTPAWEPASRIDSCEIADIRRKS